MQSPAERAADRRSRRRLPASESVRRLAVERTIGEKLITLIESGPAGAPLTQEQLGIVRAQSEQSLARLGLSIDLSLNRDRVEARLKAGDKIGTVRLVDGKRYLDVIVEPKLGDTDFLKMIETSFGQLDTWDQEAPAYATPGNPSGLLLEFVARELCAFLERHVFRDYSLFHDSGTRSPRGRLDIRGYSTESAPHLKYDVMPCSYFLYSPDVAENQVLATTVKVMGRLAGSLPLSSRRRLISLLARVRPTLSAVSTPHIGESFFERIHYHSGNRRFMRIHQLCRLVLGSATVSLAPGQRVGFSAFALSMSELFERYIRALITSTVGAGRYPPKSKIMYPIGARRDAARLDGLLSTDDSRVVVECKYKNVEKLSGEFDDSLISPADIHQVICYGVHSRVEATECLLLYPTLDGRAPALREVLRIDQFQRGHGQPMILKVMLVSLRSSVPALLEALRDNLTPRLAVPEKNPQLARIA